MTDDVVQAMSEPLLRIPVAHGDGQGEGVLASQPTVLPSSHWLNVALVICSRNSSSVACHSSSRATEREESGCSR